METFGEIIRKLRKEKKLPLRTIADFLGIDTAILSKIERGQRKPPREMAVKLAKYFRVKEEELLISWLSDKIVYETEDEDIALKAMQVAEDKIEYKTYRKTDRKAILRKIKDYLKMDKRVTKAWIFGSFARGDDDYKSDIDMLIEVPENSKFSYFDLADIQYHLEGLTEKKVDIGFYGSMREGIWDRVKNELKLFYEK